MRVAMGAQARNQMPGDIRMRLNAPDGAKSVIKADAMTARHRARTVPREIPRDRINKKS